MSCYGSILTYVGIIIFIRPPFEGPREYFAILPVLIGRIALVIGSIHNFYREIRRAMFEQQERHRRALDC